MKNFVINFAKTSKGLFDMISRLFYISRSFKLVMISFLPKVESKTDVSNLARTSVFASPYSLHILFHPPLCAFRTLFLVKIHPPPPPPCTLPMKPKPLNLEAGGMLGSPVNLMDRCVTYF